MFLRAVSLQILIFIYDCFFADQHSARVVSRNRNRRDNSSACAGMECFFKLLGVEHRKLELLLQRRFIA